MRRKSIILLVEDRQDDILLALRAFKKLSVPCEVVIARDGSEAIRLLHGEKGDQNAAPGIQPDVILLDLHLPKMEGKEVLRAIRHHPMTRRLPVVVLTTSDACEDVSDSYSLGANSFIRKPVDFQDFETALGHLGRYWLEINHPPPELCPG